MFIAVGNNTKPTPLRGAEVDLGESLRNRSAPLNGAVGVLARGL